MEDYCSRLIHSPRYVSPDFAPYLPIIDLRKRSALSLSALHLCDIPLNLVHLTALLQELPALRELWLDDSILLTRELFQRLTLHGAAQSNSDIVPSLVTLTLMASDWFEGENTEEEWAIVPPYSDVFHMLESRSNLPVAQHNHAGTTLVTFVIISGMFRFSSRAPSWVHPRRQKLALAGLHIETHHPSQDHQEHEWAEEEARETKMSRFMNDGPPVYTSADELHEEEESQDDSDESGEDEESEEEDGNSGDEEESEESQDEKDDDYGQESNEMDS